MDSLTFEWRLPTLRIQNIHPGVPTKKRKRTHNTKIKSSSQENSGVESLSTQKTNQLSPNKILTIPSTPKETSPLTHRKVDYPVSKHDIRYLIAEEQNETPSQPVSTNPWDDKQFTALFLNSLGYNPKDSIE